MTNDILDIIEQNLKKAIGRNVVFIQDKTGNRSKIISITEVNNLLIKSSIGKTDTFFSFNENCKDKMVIL